MANILLHVKELLQKLQMETVNIDVYLINHVYQCLTTKYTSYELQKCKKPSLFYFQVFGSKYYILRDREYLGKLDPKGCESIFLRYSHNSRAYHAYNFATKISMEFVNRVVVDAGCSHDNPDGVDDIFGDAQPKQQ